MTSLRKSFDSIPQTLNTVAPNTFLTPISLVRCSATKEVSPNKPRQLIKMAKAVKIRIGSQSVPLRQILPRIRYPRNHTQKEDLENVL